MQLQYTMAKKIEEKKLQVGYSWVSSFYFILFLFLFFFEIYKIYVNFKVHAIRHGTKYTLYKIIIFSYI
jgi:hypothetical protein